MSKEENMNPLQKYDFELLSKIVPIPALSGEIPSDSIIITTIIECPGSILSNGQNKHNLIIIGNSKKKLCRNAKCYFCYINDDNTEVWETGFDHIKSSNFVKTNNDKNEILF